MLRRHLAHGLLGLTLLGGTLALAEPAGASPVQLYVPQSTAFSVLGHSCGGIQEKAYVTGFAPTTGYPAGDVYLSTRCGGSGRGGGYHYHTYSAWVATTWDLTGALVSTAVVTSGVSVDPTFSAYDANGNQIYNQSNSAFLVLAPGFLAPPRVTSLSPSSGPGATTVTITGTALSGATSVTFGSTAAQFTVGSDTSITAQAPTSGTGTVDVRVTDGAATSPVSPGDQFTSTSAPLVTSISPSQGSADGGTSVTITGVNFVGVTAVRFGGVAGTFKVKSPTSIVAVSPAASDSGITVDVTVTTRQGTSIPRPADQFSYV